MQYYTILKPCLQLPSLLEEGEYKNIQILLFFILDRKIQKSYYNEISFQLPLKEGFTMCGIVGFSGKQNAAPILLEGLSKLEYRGYDSAGIAVRDGDKDPVIVKAKGRLKILVEKTNGGMAGPGCCGIGHSRWATHGETTETNAHPHCSEDMNVVGVHYGIIESYQEIKEKLTRKGYHFYSQTDTEALINY